MILGGNHNEKKTHVDWSLFISISMTGMPGYWNDSFCSCVVQHLREPGCPYWFDGLGGSFSCRKVGRPNGDADCTWSAEKVLFGGFSRQSWWVWNQPYKQKAQGLFFSPNFSGIFTASNVPVSSSHTYHDESTDVCGPVCLKVAGGLRFHGL